MDNSYKPCNYPGNYLVGEQEGLNEGLVGWVQVSQGTHHQHKHSIVGWLLGIDIAVGEVHLGVLEVEFSEGLADGLRSGGGYTCLLWERERESKKLDYKVT